MTEAVVRPGLLVFVADAAGQVERGGVASPGVMRLAGGQENIAKRH